MQQRKHQATGFQNKLIQNPKVRGTIMHDLRLNSEGKMQKTVVGYREPKAGLTMGDQVAEQMGIKRAA